MEASLKLNLLGKRGNFGKLRDGTLREFIVLVIFFRLQKRTLQYFMILGSTGMVRGLIVALM